MIKFFIGIRGVYSNSGGIKIAYLSGVMSRDNSKKGYEFNKDDVNNLRDSCLRGQPNFRGVDILLTSQWPKNVYNLDLSYKVRIKKIYTVVDNKKLTL